MKKKYLSFLLLWLISLLGIWFVYAGNNPEASWTPVNFPYTPLGCQKSSIFQVPGSFSVPICYIDPLGFGTNNKYFDIITPSDFYQFKAAIQVSDISWNLKNLYFENKTSDKNFYIPYDTWVNCTTYWQNKKAIQSWLFSAYCQWCGPFNGHIISWNTVIAYTSSTWNCAARTFNCASSGVWEVSWSPSINLSDYKYLSCNHDCSDWRNWYAGNHIHWTTLTWYKYNNTGNCASVSNVQSFLCVGDSFTWYWTGISSPIILTQDFPYGSCTDVIVNNVTCGSASGQSISSYPSTPAELCTWLYTSIISVDMTWVDGAYNWICKASIYSDEFTSNLWWTINSFSATWGVIWDSYVFHVFGNDPYIYKWVSFDESNNKFTMRYKSYVWWPNVFQIYYVDGKDCTVYSETCNQNFSIINDGAWHILNVTITDAEWIDNDGTITNIRLDPAVITTSGDFYIDYFKFGVWWVDDVSCSATKVVAWLYSWYQCAFQSTSPVGSGYLVWNPTWLTSASKSITGINYYLGSGIYTNTPSSYVCYANAVCGSASWVSTLSYPSSSTLCTRASSIIDVDTVWNGWDYNWTCKWLWWIWADANCSAPKTSVTIITWSCGTASGLSFSSEPNDNQLCNTYNSITKSVSFSWVSYNSSFSWTCNGTGWWTSMTCNLNKVYSYYKYQCQLNGTLALKRQPINYPTDWSSTSSSLATVYLSWASIYASPTVWNTYYVSNYSCKANWVCGSANGNNYYSMPTTDCKVWSYGGVGDYWDYRYWTCAGINWWTTASCYAYKSQDATCGSADGQSFITEPSDSQLCGTYDSIYKDYVNNSPYSWNALSQNATASWTCVGINWWSNSPTCSATRVYYPRYQCQFSAWNGLIRQPIAWSSATSNSSSTQYYLSDYIYASSSNVSSYSCTCPVGQTLDVNNGCYTPVNPVVWECGTAINNSTSTPPISNLCSGWNAGSVTTNPNTYDWTCYWVAWWADESCSSTRLLPVAWACASTHYNCTAWTSKSTALSSNKYTWICGWVNGWSDSSTCSECATDYHFSGSVCVSNTENKTWNCNAKVSNSDRNTVSSYNQTRTWNGSSRWARSPTDDSTTEKMTSASTTSCGYKCNTWWTWSTCSDEIKDGDCGKWVPWSYKFLFDMEEEHWTYAYCDVWTRSVVSTSTTWFTWSCAWVNWWSPVNCSVSRIIDWACGTANGVSYTNAGGTTTDVVNYFNTLQLCNPTASPTVTASSNNATWSCAGSNGGTTAACTGIYNITKVDPTCAANPKFDSNNILWSYSVPVITWWKSRTSSQISANANNKTTYCTAVFSCPSAWGSSTMTETCTYACDAGYIVSGTVSSTTPTASQTCATICDTPNKTCGAGWKASSNAQWTNTYNVNCSAPGGAPVSQSCSFTCPANTYWAWTANGCISKPASICSSTVNSCLFGKTNNGGTTTFPWKCWTVWSCSWWDGLSSSTWCKYTCADCAGINVAGDNIWYVGVYGASKLITWSIKVVNNCKTRRVTNYTCWWWDWDPSEEPGHRIGVEGVRWWNGAWYRWNEEWCYLVDNNSDGWWEDIKPYCETTPDDLIVEAGFRYDTALDCESSSCRGSIEDYFNSNIFVKVAPWYNLPLSVIAQWFKESCSNYEKQTILAYFDYDYSYAKAALGVNNPYPSSMCHNDPCYGWSYYYTDPPYTYSSLWWYVTVNKYNINTHSCGSTFKANLDYTLTPSSPTFHVDPSAILCETDMYRSSLVWKITNPLSAEVYNGSNSY